MEWLERSGAARELLASAGTGSKFKGGKKQVQVLDGHLLGHKREDH